jgi:hypothetical protein
MLYQETVDPAVLELLRSLQSKEYLKGFYLMGVVRSLEMTRSLRGAKQRSNPP